MKVYFYNNYVTEEERKADKADREAKQKLNEEMLAAQRKHEKQKKKELHWSNFRKKVQKVWGYLTLEFVQIRQGPTPRKEYKRRVELCRACPGRTEEMDGKRDEGGIGFCTKCGCPASQRSQLSVKLTISSLACPLNKFGPVQGSGATWRNAARSLLGILQTLRAVVTRRK